MQYYYPVIPWASLFLLLVFTPFISSHTCAHHDAILQYPHYHSTLTASSQYYNDIKHSTHLQKHQKRNSSFGSFQSLRMHIEFDNLASLSTLQQDYVKNILFPTAVEWFSNAVYVQPVVGNLSLSRQCLNYSQGELHQCLLYDGASSGASGPSMCGPVPIPENHLAQQYLYFNDSNIPPILLPGGSGIPNADLVVYVSSGDNSICNDNPSLLAFACSCRQDQYDRPVAGYIHICPNLDVLPTKTNLPHLWQQHVNSIIHELSHIVAFSPVLFSFYRNSTTMEPLTPRITSDMATANPKLWGSLGMPNTPPLDGGFMPSNVTTLQFFNERNETGIAKLILPTMLSKARSHFNCSTLNGVELENQGSNLTILAHLEKRIYSTDFMTGVFINGITTQISDITLASFEDSGWYKINYNYTSPLVWGSNMGCAFADSPCLTAPLPSAPSNSPPSNPFPQTWCTVSDEYGCSYGGFGIGLCFMATAPLGSIPSPFRYFPASMDSIAVGGVTLADYCPFQVQFAPLFANPILNTEQEPLLDNLTYTDCRFSSGQPSASMLAAGMEEYSPSSRCFNANLLAEKNNQVTSDTPAFGNVRCYQVQCVLQAPVTSPPVYQLLVKIGSYVVDCGFSFNQSSIANPDSMKRTVPGFQGTLTCPDPSSICFNNCPNQCSGLGNCILGQCQCLPGWEGIDCSQYTAYEPTPRFLSNHSNVFSTSSKFSILYVVIISYFLLFW